MNASLEISMYPLTPEYGTPILQFIERLKTYDSLHVKSNTMSTQVFGPYDDLMDTLKKEVKVSFEAGHDMLVVLKLANLDLTP